MNTSIRPQQPKFNTGNARNHRDTVYKMGPLQVYTFYELYTDINLVLAPISSYKNETIRDREFEKIKRECATIISVFFLPALDRTEQLSEHNARSLTFKSQLKSTLAHFDLQSLELVAVDKTPVPNDVDLLAYCNQFLNYILKIAPSLQDTSNSTTTLFKKPHMLGMSIEENGSKDLFKYQLKQLQTNANKKYPTQYHRKHHTFSSSNIKDSAFLRQ